MNRLEINSELLNNVIEDKEISKYEILEIYNNSLHNNHELFSVGQMLQKKFVLTRGKIELQMRYKTEEMNDIKAEMQMLEADDVVERKELRNRWGKVKKEKKQLYDHWVTFTEQEESRRVNVKIE